MAERKNHSFKESIRKTFVRYALFPAMIFTLVAFLAVAYIFYGSLRRENAAVNADTAQKMERICAGYMLEAERFCDEADTVRSVARSSVGVELYSVLYQYVNAQEMRGDFYIINAENTLLAGSVNAEPVYLSQPPLYNIGIARKARENPQDACISVEYNDAARTQRVLTIGKAIQSDERTIGVLVFALNEQDFIEGFLNTSSTNIVLTDRHDYVCWSTGALFTNRYGKLEERFQGRTGSVAAMDTRFFSRCTPILSGDVCVYTISEYGVYENVFLTVGATLVALFAVLAVCIFLASREAAEKKTAVIDRIVDTMQYARAGDFSHPLAVNTGDEFEQMAESYNKMLNDIQQLIADKEELARQNVLSEIKQLETQFDPHFLFNTLELIKYMTKIAPDEVGKVIVGLSGLLRESINNAVSMIPLRQDLQYTENYLMIQKYRFGSKLEYTVDVTPAAAACMVPKRIIQPIVENAMNYGRDSKDHCSLHVAAAVRRDGLVIEITDEGAGIAPEQLREIRRILRQRRNTSTHNGMYNVHRRLGLIYGEPYGLEIATAEGQGTTIRMRLPANEGQDENAESIDR